MPGNLFLRQDLALWRQMRDWRSKRNDSDLRHDNLHSAFAYWLDFGFR
jgi:hypothetical protein